MGISTSPLFNDELIHTYEYLLERDCSRGRREDKKYGLREGNISQAVQGG